MKLAAIDLVGLILSIVLFLGLLWPTLPMRFKRMYYKVNRITLVTQRRLYLSLLQGLIFTIPTFLFVLHDVYNGKNFVKTFAKHYLPLAAYVFFPIFIAWVRPLAANPLDLWDVLLVVGLIGPIVVQIIFDKHTILFDQSFTSSDLWIDFHSLYLIAGSLSIFIYSVLRPLPDVGLGKEMRLPTLWDLFVSVLGFGLLVAILPLLVYTDHAFDRVTNIPPLWVLCNFGLIFLFVALPLELVFRGVIQNLFHARVEVIRDVRQYTTDSDTNQKIGRFALSRITSLFSNRPQNNRHITSHHQYRQTEDLLELSLQLGAPAQAQNPLQPHQDQYSYSSLAMASSRQPSDMIPSQNSHHGGNNNNNNSVLLDEQHSPHKESLLQVSTSSSKPRSLGDTSILSGMSSNGQGHGHGNTVHFEPEPLFPSQKGQKHPLPAQNVQNGYVNPSIYAHDEGSTRMGLLGDRDLSSTMDDDVDSIYHNHHNYGQNGHNYSQNYSQNDHNVPNAANSQYSKKSKKSVTSYHLSSKNGNAVTTSPFDIQDTTSQMLGVGYVSKQDAQLAAMQARSDYITDLDFLDESDPTNPNTYDQLDPDSANSINGNGKKTLGLRQGMLGQPKINEVAFDQNLFRTKQREGYGISFEESPVWPTWQERHARFYKKSFFHWFILPSKIDYLCLIVSTLIYAGALTYNVGYFIEHAHETPIKLQSYTWFTLFVVLSWQGFICGLLWRMSSQIWSSVLITAGFFTLGAYWLGIDG